MNGVAASFRVGRRRSMVTAGGVVDMYMVPKFDIFTLLYQGTQGKEGFNEME